MRKRIHNDLSGRRHAIGLIGQIRSQVASRHSGREDTANIDHVLEALMTDSVLPDEAVKRALEIAEAILDAADC